MQEFQSQESFAGKVFREPLRKTMLEVSLGFPSADELHRRRKERWESERNRLLRRQQIEDEEFQRLKDAALTQFRKDRS